MDNPPLYNPALLKGLPFKGKGMVQRRIVDLRAQRQNVTRAMEVLASSFKQTFSPPWPAHLALHRDPRSGATTLRWRAPGNRGQNQTFFTLLTSDRGQALVSTLQKPVRLAFLRFHRAAVELNTASSLITVELSRLQDFTTQLLLLEQAENR